MPGLRDYASWPFFTARSTKTGTAGGVAAESFGMPALKRLLFEAERLTMVEDIILTHQQFPDQGRSQMFPQPLSPLAEFIIHSD
jgi:hypothetical protein